ncbi:MAG TPA: tetratricopeptide repeat protein, partial [Methylocystis sp.]
DGFSNAKSVAREWAGAVAGFFAHKPILSGAAGLAAAAALVGVLYGIRVGTQASVAALLVVSGSTLASFGQLDQAMSKYGAALAYKPDFLPALGARAAGYRVTQNYDRALAELDRAVALYPDDPAVHGARAEIFVELHDSVKAIAEFDKAIALDGSNALLYAGRGGVRIETSDLDGALDDANRALSRRPGLSAAHVLRANVYRERDDLRQALVELDAAVKADEKNIGAYFGRALARFETRDYAGATQDFRRVLQAPEKRAYAALWLFVSGTRAGNDPRREVATWAGTLPRSVWPFPLIEFYLGVKNVEGVTAAATNADQRCELDFYRGELLFLRKNFKTAADALRTAAAECPKGYIETRAARTELKLVEAQMPMGEPALTPPSVLPSAAGSPQTVRTLSPPAAEQSKIAAPGSDAPVTASWSFRRQEGAPPKGGALTIVTPSGVDASTITFTLLRATEEQTGAEYLLKATVRQPAKTTAVGGSRINFQIPRGDEKAVMDLSVPMAMPGYYQSSLSQGEFENALNALSSARRVIVALVSSNKAAAPRSFAIDVDAFAKAALASAAPFLSDAPEAPLPSPPLAIQTMGGTGRRLALPPALSR